MPSKAIPKPEVPAEATQEERDRPYQTRLSVMLQAEYQARIKWLAGGTRGQKDVTKKTSTK
jgi:hypothetical protein